jgi:hypothetical protein
MLLAHEQGSGVLPSGSGASEPMYCAESIARMPEDDGLLRGEPKLEPDQKVPIMLKNTPWWS